MVCARMCQDGPLSVSQAKGTACAEAHGRELGVLTTVGYVWSRGRTGSKEMSGREDGLSIKASGGIWGLLLLPGLQDAALGSN